VAQEWSAYLDAAAAKATTPGQRTVLDSHRLGAYHEHGQPERALPMLLQSEKDFPQDYNPPARLAAAYKELKRWPEALAAADRALARAYGPRKLRVFDGKAEILKASGDVAGAKRTLQEALAHARTLPAGQKPERWIAGIEKKLASLEAPPKAP
jgi:tetratricopeptide (TPR) repeat protein